MFFIEINFYIWYTLSRFVAKALLILRNLVLVRSFVMNTEIIKTFLKLVEFKSITGAAEALFLSQSTVSHRLKQLEETLGDTLIVRSKGRHGIELTPRGVAFVPLAERWILLSKDTEQFQNSVIGQDLIIASIDSVNAYALGPMYRDIAQLPDHPMNLDLRTYQSFQVQMALENHEVDVGFLVRKHPSRNLIFKPIFRERFVLIGHFDNDEGDEIDPRLLDPAYEVLLFSSIDYLDWHNYYFDSSISPWAEIDTPAMLLNFLENEKVWGIITESSAEFLKFHTGVKIYRMENPPPDRICYEVCHRFPLENKLAAIRMFDDYLEKYIETNPLLIK